MSISPVVLISAVGLLLLSVTNRLGRAIDRSRAMTKALDGKEHGARREGIHQLKFLLRRCRLLRASISLIILSIFFSGLMILVLFAEIFSGVDISRLVLVLFALNIAALLASVVYFLLDIFSSLDALFIEVARHVGNE